MHHESVGDAQRSEHASNSPGRRDHSYLRESPNSKRPKAISFWRSAPVAPLLISTNIKDNLEQVVEKTPSPSERING